VLAVDVLTSGLIKVGLHCRKNQY